MGSTLQAHQILEREVQRPINISAIPSHFSVAIHLRNAFNDSSVSVKRVMEIIQVEPMVSAHVVRAANVAALYTGDMVMDLEKAINKIGMATVKRIALGVAVSQLSRSKDLLPFSGISRGLWLSSLYTAAASRTIATALTTLSAEEAQFSGLIRNLGCFYILYIASKFSETRCNLTEVKNALSKYGQQVNIAVLKFIGYTPEFLERYTPTDVQLTQLRPPKNWADVITMATLVSDAVYHPFTEDAASIDLPDLYKDLDTDTLTCFNALKEDFSI